MYWCVKHFLAWFFRGAVKGPRSCKNLRKLTFAGLHQPASQPAKASSTSQPARFLETGQTSRNRPPGQTGWLTGIKIVNEMVVVSLAGFACRKVCAPETNSSGTCKCHDNANMFYVPLADWFPQKCGLTVKNGSQRKRLVNICRSFHARQTPTKKTIVITFSS